MDDPQQGLPGLALETRPTTDDDKTWRAYWAARSQPWRIQPEIAADRQAYLADRRGISPDIEQGIYPFKGIEPALTRADIEWLLATHDDERGPVVWEEEKDKFRDERRIGVDLRGADLREADLSALPLACVRGGLAADEWLQASSIQREWAQVQLERAVLSKA